MTFVDGLPSSDLVITVVTTDPVYYTNADVTYYIKATLDDYIILYPDEVTHWEPFVVQIINCQVTDYTYPTVTD